MEDSIKNEQVYEQVKQLLYAENLDSSKVSKIMNEEMIIKVEEMFMLKEVEKVVPSKENLLEILHRIDTEGNIVKLNRNSNEITILLDENFTAFKLINVPSKLKKQDLAAILDINEENGVLRMYKHSLYWIVISNRAEFNQNFEKKLKQVKFDGEPLMFDATASKDLRRQINKQIQHNAYLKETDELKGSSSNGRKDSNSNKQSDRKYSNTPSTGNTEALSWRKKSDVSNNSAKEETQVNNINNYPKKVSIFNPTSTTGFNRRERFNSDPHDKRKIIEDIQSPFNGSHYLQPDIFIDPKLVSYSLTINRKYTHQEIFNFYEKFSENLTKSVGEFTPFVDEVCNPQSKNLSFTRFTNSRKNSENVDKSKENQSLVNQGFGVRSSLKSFDNNDKMILPKNNPLQELENMQLNK